MLGGAHSADALGEARDFSRCGLAMNHALLRVARQHRLGRLERRRSGLLVAGGDRLFHRAHGASQPGSPRFIDGGAADSLAGGFLSRFGVSHDVILEGAPGPLVWQGRLGINDWVLYSESPNERQPHRETAASRRLCAD